MEFSIQVWAKFGPTSDRASSGKVQADFGQSSGKVHAKFGQVLADFGQSSGKVRANFGSGKFGQSSG